MGDGPNVSDSEPGSSTSQPPTWAQLKAKILEAIKKDGQPGVFEALLDDVRNFIAELKLTGKLDDISVELQEDAAVFFARKRVLSEDGSKKALQLICNVLKN